MENSRSDVTRFELAVNNFPKIVHRNEHKNTFYVLHLENYLVHGMIPLGQVH